MKKTKDSVFHSRNSDAELSFESITMLETVPKSFSVKVLPRQSHITDASISNSFPAAVRLKSGFGS
jgi:hypothetical protein